MRTVHSYKTDLINLVASRASNKNNSKLKNHYRGVKAECPLNKIKGYHVTDNWCIDIMHTLLEGVVLAELGCILYGLVILDKCLTLSDINKAICLLWGKITIEKTHKPAEIFKIQEPGHVLAPSMKAVQWWALLKYLPMAVGKIVPLKNKNWKFLLHLSHLIDLIFAPCFTHEMIVYMKHVISDHLFMFNKLYCNNEVRLHPKHHFLVHLPKIITKSGPLVGMSCMPYKLKNSFFKRISHIVCNFTNICHTLAHRHQQQALESQLSNKHIRKIITVVKYSIESTNLLPFYNAIHNSLCFKSCEEIAIAKTLHAGSVEYKQGHFIAINIDKETGMPNFGKIICFISTTNNNQINMNRGEEWYFVLEIVKTNNFTYHLHSYEVIFQLLQRNTLFDCPIMFFLFVISCVNSINLSCFI
ncbi:uncharacterized protein LOC136075407 isoform X1 [Hydra vulgaris]|uniref:Uncharacterized protein LOC136075407 isoform X1 n=1 Tax=Hydra vulgaris TaxID=6087 RepID=A0ABM4B6Q9_HYDVU